MAVPEIVLFFLVTFSSIIACVTCKSIIDRACDCTSNMCNKNNSLKLSYIYEDIIFNSPKYVVT